MSKSPRRAFGDFQTPLELALTLCRWLHGQGIRPSGILEPTCGEGSFARAAAETFGRTIPIYGIEIQPGYAARLESLAREHANFRYEIGDIFTASLAANDRSCSRGMLVLGNPPWVTNSELGAIGGTNLPRKRNLRKLRGIDAATGSSNFDLAEAIIDRLIDQLRDIEPHVALLCKTHVARNVLLENERRRLGLTELRILQIDAARWFGAAVDACFFSFRIDTTRHDATASIFASVDALEASECWSVDGVHLRKHGPASDRLRYLDGPSPREWRQGVKHDAASIMELTRDHAALVNAAGEVVDVESASVFPLLKSSDLANSRLQPRKSVILTQSHPGDDTRHLEHSAPRLWAYLERHHAAFTARRSSIYRNAPVFGIFGIGPYSFAPWKLAVSGMYRAPRFQVLGTIDGKPIMLDDTCYFLPCRTHVEAVALQALLSSDDVRAFLEAITFQGAKRPVTKKSLARIDLRAVRDAESSSTGNGGVDLTP